MNSDDNPWKVQPIPPGFLPREEEPEDPPAFTAPGAMTQMHLEMAMDETLSPQDAVAFLKEGARPRSFAEILERFCPDGQGALRLAQGLQENHPALGKADAEDRVNDWMAGNHAPKDFYELCFILGFDLETAQRFITVASGEPPHWRDPNQLIYLYALQNGLSYRQAQELRQEMKDLLSRAAEDEQDSTSFTELVRSDLRNVSSKAGLRAYLKRSGAMLGTFHNNACQLFQARLDQLKKPVPLYEAEKEDRAMTTREVLREYLYVKTVSHAKQQNRLARKEGAPLFSAMEKVVSENWPSETQISRIYNRKADVTRKALILLLLATDEGYSNDLLDDEQAYAPVSREEVFQEVYERMNDTLSQCGFAQLDPRAPFDWLVLYSIYVPEIYEADERMGELLREMFGEPGPEEE